MSNGSSQQPMQPADYDRNFNDDRQYKALLERVKTSTYDNPHRIVFFIEDSVKQFQERLDTTAKTISGSFENSTKLALLPFQQTSNEITTITDLKAFARFLKYYIALKNSFGESVTFELISDQDLGGFPGNSVISQGFVSMWTHLLSPDNNYLTSEEIKALSDLFEINLILYSKQAPATDSQYSNLSGVNYKGVVIKTPNSPGDATKITNLFTTINKGREGEGPTEA